MSKKQWYVSATGFKGEKNLIQYVNNKKEAEQLQKLIKSDKVNYTAIDFVWKSDIEKKIPFSQLHGRLYTKVNNLLEVLEIQLAA
jgi:hypothetical protein